MLIEILDWSDSEVIFELDKENNTIKDTVEEAVRQGFSLRFAGLFETDLRNADLRGADLSEADLVGADLRGTDLRGTNIENANTSSAIFDNNTKIDFPMACPETGSFIGYKKILWTKEYRLYEEFIVKLEIPEDAKRSSAFTDKCRCSKAKVLEIKNIRTDETIEEIINFNMTACIYKVGEYVYPDSFDDCRWNECSNGIHFFMTEQEALDY